MKWRKKKGSLFFRICISMILLSMIPLFCVSYLWMKNTGKMVYDGEIQSASALLYELTMRIENILNSVNTSSYDFLFDTKAREIISSRPKSEKERTENEAYIQNIFSQIKKSNTMIASVEFIGAYYQISSEETVDFDELTGYSWYQDFSDYYLEHFTPVYCNSYIQNMNTRVFGWARKITPSSDSMRTVGSFLIEISHSSISSLLTEAQENSGNFIYLFDHSGNLIYSPKENILGDDGIENLFNTIKTNDEQVFSVTGRNHSYACMTDSISIPGWQAVMLVDQQEIMSYAGESIKQGFVLGLICVLASIFVAYIISRYIVKPINQLAKTMEMVEQNQLEVSVPVNQSVQEVDTLSRGFNHMLRHIRCLLKDIRKEEQEKKRLEIQMLQAQINPHFLYNTLNVIRWKAVMHGETGISSMIISLIKLLEFSGKRVNTFVTIEKELEHASSYLELIKNQYRDDFDVVYDIDPDARHCYTVKFILQPLVENAVFHGVEPSDCHGIIRIQIQRENSWIHFAIEDNGVGISEEIQKNWSAFRGLGIYNVNERLRKYFGEESVLHFDSEEGAGTRIFFKIPVLENMPEEGSYENNEENTAGG